MPEQVQDFYPTPGTISTCMFYTGLDPRDMKPVYVPVSAKEKQMQKALIQYRNPENYELVKMALIKGGRKDLIGYDEKCLIPPRKPSAHKPKASGSGQGKRNLTSHQKDKNVKQKRRSPIRNIHKKKS